ncbi:MAG: transglycosylase domain-containing protein, partial [Spirochaetes bacterium]|nr:transglycosylase domain-containing protein [Spirochaetota bacterium]
MIKQYTGNSSRFRRPDSRRGGSINLSFLRPVLNLFDEITSKFRVPKFVIIGFLCGVFIVYVGILISDFQKVRDLATYQPNVTTKIYDKNGLLISELFTQKRDVVSLKKVPKDLINAFIAIEDSEFYSHYGLNVKGIVRAFFVNLFSGSIKQGGSTITQQLAKILLTSGERNIFRKIKEASIAVFMEIFYTKEEILEMYFNQIFLGHGVYGVESASRFYFDKNVWELGTAECALLAVLPSSPNNLSPIRYPERAIARHRIVLARMVDMGFASIRDAEKCYLAFWPDYLSYISELSPTSTTWSKRIDKAPWFTEHVRRSLVAKYGEDMVYQKGLKVYTTLDLAMQTSAQRILQSALEKQTGVSSGLAFQNEDYIIENYSDLIGVFSFLYNFEPSYKKGTLEKKKFNDRVQESLVDEIEALNYIAGISNIGGAIEEYKEKYFDIKSFQNVEGCLVSIDHRNGYITAMVGGSEFTSTNQLNRVMQSKRQPGSAVKPLIYTAAFESGKYSPATTILDSPVVFMDNEGTDWIPENYEG